MTVQESLTGCTAAGDSGPHRSARVRLLTTIAVGTAILGTCSLAAASSATPTLDLMRLQVFAKMSIEANNSDYEGWTAAGDVVALRDFRIDGDLASGGRLSFERGRVSGFVSAHNTTLSQVLATQTGHIGDAGLRLASSDLDALAAKLAMVPATTRASTTTHYTAGRQVKVLRAQAQSDFEVVDLSAEQLISAGPGRLLIDLEGTTSSRLLLRIHGRSVLMRDVGFSIGGGLDPSKIAFFFPEATALDVSFSGAALDADGKSWGIPGSFVAPEAVMRFAASTVTGHVFVKSIASIAGLPSGQVNRFPSCESSSGNECPPSQILTEVPQGPLENHSPEGAVLRRKD